ncbi:hypothetical protein F0562_012946 [Nyssa sinensis]|uniref:pectinesterase n=1 Tax=Nyssa sinensis TaxID=561372 RepID=A0A5J4ZU10_9ASTE|nr:hypothetical protein F0562_012946 [Nyssa sinensis]
MFGMVEPAVATDFIETSCQATHYPSLCVECLSSYASTIQQSDQQLAQAALSVSLARARSAATFVSSMAKASGIKPTESQAVQDCIVNMGDTVNQLRRSIQEIGNMGKVAGQDFVWHVNNVQTWVSAALTDDNTCTDGFASLAMDGNVKTAINNRVINKFFFINDKKGRGLKLCFLLEIWVSSLSIYANKIQTSPRLLASTALNVTLSATRSSSVIMKKLSKSQGLSPREAAAMLDCVEEIGNSVDELKRSIEEMNYSGGPNFELQMSDIQTWVSAALTDDDTCMDGFAGNAMNGKIKSTVRSYIVKVAHLTSNALALINNYAGKQTTTP